LTNIDFIDWDDPADPDGNVRHIAEHGLTMDDIADVLSDPDSEEEVSRSSGRPIRFGQTSTGQFIAVVFDVFRDSGYTIVHPVTADEVAPRN
jgi:hypothetical protein